LSVTNLIGANLSGADLIGADLNGANLIEANLCGANLQGAKLYRSNLAYSKLTGADLRQADLSDANLAGTDLTDADLTEANLERTIVGLVGISNLTNQGIKAAYEWNGLYFRSKNQIKIAEALDRAGVVVYPNCRVRLNTAKSRDTKETDFLVFYQGKWGILEIDGEPHYSASSKVFDPESDRFLKAQGIQIIEHYDAEQCWEQPDIVVQDFLEILSQA
jgi:hypothetical protein